MELEWTVNFKIMVKYKMCKPKQPHIHPVQKKVVYLIFGHSFCKCGPIFKIYSLTDSQGNYATVVEISTSLNYVAALPCQI